MKLGKWSLGSVSTKFVLLSAIAIAGAAGWVLLPGPSGAENESLTVAQSTAPPSKDAEPLEPATPPSDSAQAKASESQTTGMATGTTGTVTTPAPAADPVTAERAPIDGLKIASQSFRRGGLGSKALVTLTLRNANDYPVKDVEIACAFLRADGSPVTARKRVIADTIGQRSRKTYAGMLIGFVNINANKAKCSLVTASRV